MHVSFILFFLTNWYEERVNIFYNVFAELIISFTSLWSNTSSPLPKFVMKKKICQTTVPGCPRPSGSGKAVELQAWKFGSDYAHDF